MTNKTAIITGGSRGIGKTTALKLAANGINTIITYNSSESEAIEVVSQLKSYGIKASSFQLDVSNPNSYLEIGKLVRNALAEINEEKFDFLINNAGIGLNRSFMDTTPEEFDRMMNIHYKSVYFITQKLVPIMNDNGAIVNISSGTTRFVHVGYSLYSSLKTAIEGLTKYLAKEFGHRGIRANIIAPGAIETDFNSGAVRDNQKINDTIASVTALGRVGQPDDIAGAIYALLSDDSSWINAQRIEVSGGQAI